MASKTFLLFVTPFALVIASCDDKAVTAPVDASTSKPEVPTTAASQAVKDAGERKAATERRADGAPLQDVIPARFHGKWAENAAACDTPGHQQYRISGREVGFFESRGIVQNVRAEGDYAAATLSEQYGDAPPAVYVFYMALENDDAMRIRYDKNPRIPIIRCPA